MKRPKILFCDLDDTLITTLSGKTFAQGIWDMQPKFEVWDKIREIMPEYVFIVTNQGGIGRFVTEQEFECKLDFITAGLRRYIKSNVLQGVDAMYCPSVEKEDPMRKPNPGMGEYLIDVFGLDDVDKSDMLMIGDASGLPGNFSDSDKSFADNFGIKYLDVNDFVRVAFQ